MFGVQNIYSDLRVGSSNILVHASLNTIIKRIFTLCQSTSVTLPKALITRNYTDVWRDSIRG